MTGNVALDIVIGLSFIYVLYSLFATIITEMIASGLSLRARNLENAIIRMLKDERKPPRLFRVKLIYVPFNLINDLFKFVYKRKSQLSKDFFEQPSIKYLSAGYFSKPSYLSPKSFSKALVDTLKTIGEGESEIEKIESALKHDSLPKNIGFGQSVEKELAHPFFRVLWLMAYPFRWIYRKFNTTALDKLGISLNAFIARLNLQLGTKGQNFLNTVFDEKNTDQRHISNLRSDIKKFKTKIIPSTEADILLSRLQKVERSISVKSSPSNTLNHIRSLLDDSHGDMIKFREALESWFDDTMLRCTGWYKRKSKIITFSVGLVIAILFNADTIRIIDKLAVDDKARTQLVDMAKSYVESNKDLLTDTTKEQNEMRKTVVKMDSTLREQMDQANLLIGGWSELPKERLKIQLNEDTAYASIKIKGYSFTGELIFNFIPIISIEKKMTTAYYNKISADLLRKKNNPDSLNLKDWVNKSYRQTYYTGDLSSIQELEPAIVSLPFDKFWKNPWGFIATAFAISLGANFWFDLLNKLVKLRSSVAIPNSQEAAKPGSKKKEIIKG